MAVQAMTLGAGRFLSGAFFCPLFFAEHVVFLFVNPDEGGAFG